MAKEHHDPLRPEHILKPDGVMTGDRHDPLPAPASYSVRQRHCADRILTESLADKPNCTRIIDHLRRLAEAKLSAGLQITLGARMLVRMSGSLLWGDETVLVFSDSGRQPYSGDLGTLLLSAWSLATGGVKAVSGDTSAATDGELRDTMSYRGRVFSAVDDSLSHAIAVKRWLSRLLSEQDSEVRELFLEQLTLCYLTGSDPRLEKTSSAFDELPADHDQNVQLALAAIEGDLALANLNQNSNSRGAGESLRNASDIAEVFFARLWCAGTPGWWNSSFGWPEIYSRILQLNGARRSFAEFRKSAELIAALEYCYAPLVKRAVAPNQELSQPDRADEFLTLCFPAMDADVSTAEAAKLAEASVESADVLRNKIAVVIQNWLRSFGRIDPNDDSCGAFVKHVTRLLSNYHLALRIPRDPEDYGQLDLKHEVPNRKFVIRNSAKTRSIDDDLRNASVVLVD